jgi:hypothetical protein
MTEDAEVIGLACLLERCEWLVGVVGDGVDTVAIVLAVAGEFVGVLTLDVTPEGEARNLRLLDLAEPASAEPPQDGGLINRHLRYVACSPTSRKMPTVDTLRWRLPECHNSGRQSVAPDSKES